MKGYMMCKMTGAGEQKETKWYTKYGPASIAYQEATLSTRRPRVELREMKDGKWTLLRYRQITETETVVA